jgi:hypothetical protein
LDAVITVQWLYPGNPKFKKLGLKYCIREHTKYFVHDVKKKCWSAVIHKEHPDAVLDEFMKFLLSITDEDVPLIKAPLIDE